MTFIFAERNIISFWSKNFNIADFSFEIEALLALFQYNLNEKFRILWLGWFQTLLILRYAFSTFNFQIL